VAFSDSTVDVLCIGSGPATLVAAISAAEAGLTVLVTDHHRRHQSRDPGHTHGPRSWATVLRNTIAPEGLPDETMAYLQAVTDTAGQPNLSRQPNELAIRPLGGASSFSSRDRTAVVAPFYGSELRQWMNTCLTSPHGVLCTRVSFSGARELILDGGERIDVRGTSLPVHSSDVPLSSWVLEQARARGIDVRTGMSLRRLIFNEDELVDDHGAHHEVMGAAFEDHSGTRVVHARHGVVMATGQRRTDGCPDVSAALMSTLASMNPRLGVVSNVASRFGRLEILTDAAPPPRPSEAEQQRRFATGLRER
jgi:hypothetical protein